MSTLESIHREYDTLAASVQQAKELSEQFPDDWTLKIKIAQAEQRLADLNIMLLAPMAEA